MTIQQQLVEPAKIESELLRLWEGLAKEKIRACLFNLIVFNRLSARTDYIRDIVQKVSEKYPCRVLFITEDPNSKNEYIKTAVSVVGGGNIACDYIDIGVSGASIEKVPFVILPHFITDLPISLLWTEDPTLPHSLFDPLLKLAHRVIFDSESADSLLAFSQKILELKKVDTADLNWARIEGWRDLIASLFHVNASHLDQIQNVEIVYNERATESFCHLKVQSLYILAWMASRLGWKFKGATQDLKFTFEKQSAQIRSEKWEKLGPGTVIAVNIQTHDGYFFEQKRIRNQYHNVLTKTSSPEKCEMPYQFVLGKTATGQSLVKEIITKGTSLHYLEMLKTVSQIDKDRLC